MTNYDEQLQTLRTQIARKERLETVLRDVRNQKIVLGNKLAQLEKAKRDEEKDVKRLEGHSLAALFYAVTSKKDEMLDKERREAYEAAVKYDMASRELAAVEEDLQKYEAELETLQGCEARYEQVLREKAKAMRAAGISAEEGMSLEEQLTQLEKLRIEIDEAAAAGERVRRIADKMASHLEVAGKWSKNNISSRGGLVSSIMKYEALDDAEMLLGDFWGSLSRFKTELADVNVFADLQVFVNEFPQFDDCFFSGLFADIGVHNRIQNSREEVQAAKLQVTDALKKIYTMQSDVEKKYARTKAKLERLVDNTEL